MRTYTPAEGYTSDILTHSRPLNCFLHFKLWLQFACTARFPHLKSGVEIPSRWCRTGINIPPNIPLYTGLGVNTGIYRYIIARYTGICRTLIIKKMLLNHFCLKINRTVSVVGRSVCALYQNQGPWRPGHKGCPYIPNFKLCRFLTY